MTRHKWRREVGPGFRFIRYGTTLGFVFESVFDPYPIACVPPAKSAPYSTLREAKAAVLWALSGSRLAPVPAKSSAKRRWPAHFLSPLDKHPRKWRTICRRRWRRERDEMSRRSMRITRSTWRKCREWGYVEKRETRAETAAKCWPATPRAGAERLS